MIDAYLLLLERVSEIHNSQKKRVVFLINNLDHVVCIFQERRVTGKECNKLLERLLKFREDFVEEELLTGFSKMIAFVQQTEAHMSSVQVSRANNGGNVEFDINPSVVESLVLDFASNWKSNIDQINRNVLSYFSNFRNGMEILKHCLTQLLLYYTRFQDIIRKAWKKSQPHFTKDLVSTNVILAEIKRYALAI
jgi:vacuolar protein sorting-associated protein 52